MKKSLLTLAATAALMGTVGLATPALAQSSAITNAILSQKAGQLDKALESINQAVASDKTKDKDKPKAWFTRGEIYYQLVDPSTQALFAKYTANMQPGEALQKAAESYQKALALDGPTGEYGKQVPARLQNLYGLAFNAGVKSYNDKDYDKAIANYKLASQMNPQDTTAVLYGAYAYSAKQDYAGAKSAYNQLLGMDAYKTKPAPVGVYTQLLQMARQEKNDAEAQKVLQQALAAYPNNKTFLIEDLNVAMSGGTVPERWIKSAKPLRPTQITPTYTQCGAHSTINRVKMTWPRPTTRRPLNWTRIISIRSSTWGYTISTRLLTFIPRLARWI
nr:tetratricopeptide repeat protein [Hymenobacter sp. BRD128]